MNLNDVILDTNLFGKKRIPTSQFDFGDDATICLHVKRITNDGYVDHDFGIYLGKVKGKYYIGTSEILSFLPSKLESFDSLEELKKVWQLD